jgi:hypothetical protein
MSRYNTTAVIDGVNHKAAYGWEEMSGFKPGYFLQIENPKNEDDMIVNEGFMDGLDNTQFQVLIETFKVHVRSNHLYPIKINAPI